MRRGLGWVGLAAFLVACSSNVPGEVTASSRQALISDAVHGQGNAGFFFLPPMVPSFPSALGASAPPASLVGPWVVIDRVALSPAGCTTDCVATVLTSNVTTITKSGTSTGTGIPISKGDARNRLQYHVNHAASDPSDPEPDDDLADVPDGYWSAHWDSDDFGTVVNGFYRAHIYASVDGAPLELGFADIEVVPDGISKAAYRKIDRSLYAPLKYGRTLSINFQIQPGALVPPVKTLATGLLFPHIAIDANNVYWTDTYAGTVQKVPLAGGAVTTLASGLFYPANPAVSASGVYFTTFTGPAVADTVQSVPLTGGTPQLIASGLPNVWGLAVDGVSVYWSQSQGIASGSVQKAPLAGGPVTVLGSAADGVYEPASLSVTGNTVYWNDFNSVSIRSAPTAGGAPPATVVSTNNWTYALTTDASSVFWTQPDLSVPGNWLLRTAPLAGGATTTLVTSPGLDYGAHTFASDGANVYYVILSGGTVDLFSATGYAILKVPVSGGAPTTIVSKSEGLNQYPTSLAVDGARVYWAAAGNVYSAPK